MLIGKAAWLVHKTSRKVSTRMPSVNFKTDLGILCPAFHIILAGV